MINTAAYSFASQAYPDNVEKVVSVMEGVVGIGITISPIMGVFIYSAVGFANVFYIFGSAMAPCAFLMLLLPNPKDLKSKNNSQISHDDDAEKLHEVYDLVEEG